MPNVDYATVFNPQDEDLEPIRRGLHEYNVSKLGTDVIDNYTRLAIVARDAENRVVGGIYGELFWDWLYIQTLWVDEEHRGQGIGTRLLAMAEDAAVSKGFHKSHLETTNFQGLAFYLKNGYQVFGALEGKPAGSTWYYIKKELS